MAAPTAPDQILDVNRRYHDVAAADYDAKWGISFGEIGRHQVLGKVTKLLGERPGPFARSLEIGSGTGYFSLNLMQAGVIGAATCTDISPGMLETLEATRSARARGGDGGVRRIELPFDDEASTSCSATPCSTTCRTSTARSRSSTACSRRAGRCSSPASRLGTVTGSPPCPSAPRCGSRPRGAGC